MKPIPVTITSIIYWFYNIIADQSGVKKQPTKSKTIAKKMMKILEPKKKPNKEKVVVVAKKNTETTIPMSGEQQIYPRKIPGIAREDEINSSEDDSLEKILGNKKNKSFVLRSEGNTFFFVLI